MSKITFAGVGGAFTTQEYWQSNMLLETPEGKMMIDCGTDARFSFGELGMKATDPNAIYISHLHADHIGGLEWLGFSTYFNPNCDRPKMYLVGDLVDDLWRSLQSGMQSCEGGVLSLESFFDVQKISPNGSFNYGDCNLTPIQTVHVMNGFRIVHSYGLMINRNGRKSFLTTDTQFCPRQIEKFYNQAEVIFQDCETSPFKTGVHAHYEDLKTLSPEVKKKMWLYHYQPNPPYDAVADGFAGFIKKGQAFDL
jgi:ribonuclease BN (tRNA processing enzyme)